MTKAVEQLKPQLETLSKEERAELAHFLLQSLDPDEDQGVSEAWDREITRRVEEIRNGRVVGRPAEQVFAELRERYP